MSESQTKTKEDMNRAARESFSGRLLTDPQFEEAYRITSIIEREIRKSGTFKDKLADYAHAFARTEKFDGVRAEMIMRDIFRERTGQTMNGLREALLEREKALTDQERQRGYPCAEAVGPMIEKGNDAEGRRMTFHRAAAYQAQVLGRELGVTDNCAWGLMKEGFKAQRGTEFYDWGKALEQRFYTPLVEAERQQREANADRPQRSAPTRSGPSRS
ncbi:MAG: hypothetical protein WDN25_13615 [Acetobacteraceae bacterium]